MASNNENDISKPMLAAIPIFKERKLKNLIMNLLESNDLIFIKKQKHSVRGYFLSI